MFCHYQIIAERINRWPTINCRTYCWIPVCRLHYNTTDIRVYRNYKRSRLNYLVFGCWFIYV